MDDAALAAALSRVTSVPDAHGQPVGLPVPGWTPRPAPERIALAGRWVRIEPLDPARHADGLFEAYGADRDGRLWTYLGHGPFPSRRAFDAWIEQAASGADPRFFALLDGATGAPRGMAAYLRIAPAAGSLEIGSIALAPAMQRTTAATEALFLMIRHAFVDLGYRRVEWKCDALNAASRSAALRLGFRFEGLFRQALVYKGRNRDTAWFGLIDRDWPARRRAFEAWLDPDNFDRQGRQRRRLATLIAET